MFEFLKRERDAFQLFKAAYKASFPPKTEPPPCAELNISPTQLASETDVVRRSLFLVTLEEALFASPEEGRFAEIEWL